MQKVISILTVGLLCFVASQSAQAGVLTGSYTFPGADPGGDATVPTQANMTYGGFSRANVSSVILSDVFASSAWSSGGRDTTEYVQFILTPSPGYYLNLQHITFDSYISAAKAPTSGQVEIFLGTGLTSMGSQTFTPGNTGVNFDFTDFDTANNQAVTIRFYGWGANSSGQGEMNFDNVAVFGNVNPVPEPVNVALGIFGGVFLVVVVARSQPVRNRVQRCRAAFVVWVNAV
jgi:hypothetical protein